MVLDTDFLEYRDLPQSLRRAAQVTIHNEMMTSGISEGFFFI
jgi:hypothetical protein